MKKAVQLLLAIFAFFSLAFYIQSLDSELELLVNQASGGLGKSHFILPNETDLNNIPQDPLNSLSPEKVALGCLLFHETGLLIGNVRTEGRQTVSCASCHFAEKGFFANNHQGIGEGGEGFFNRTKTASYAASELDVQPIKAPTSLNLAYQTVSLWNGSFGATGPNTGTDALWTAGTPIATNHLGYEGPETQAIAGLEVHRMPVDEAIVSELGYKSLFDAAFGDVPVANRYDREHAGLAIAAYERTLLANKAPFQEWLKGDLQAMTDRQKEGAILFFGDAGCVTCHNSAALNSNTFHALGMNDLYQHPLETFEATATSGANIGRGDFTKNPSENRRFKVPQLYNLKDSDFFGHGSSFTTVRDVLSYKNAAIAENSDVPTALLSPLFQPLSLSEHQIDALTDFIENGLYDPNLMRYKPESVLSWLNPSANDTISQIDLDYADYCSMVAVSGEANAIRIENLDAPIREVAVYDTDFNRVFYCPGDCETNLVIPNMTAGDYYVSTKFYAYNWQYICESFESVTVIDGGGNTDDCTALNLSGSDGQITISGMNGTKPSVQVFDAAWNTVFSCWQNNCGQNTLTIPNLSEGTYYVKVDYYTVDWSVICSFFESVEVEGQVDNCPIDVTFSQDMSCGSNQGWLKAEAMGGTPPYQYNWGNFVVGPAQWCIPGDYGMTVTDAAGCSKAFMGTMLPADNIQANLSINGNSVSVNPKGGQAPYLVRWTSADGYFNWKPLSVNNLPAGTYSAVVFDANWCSTEVQFSIGFSKVLASQGIDFQAIKKGGTTQLNWVLQTDKTANRINIERCHSLDIPDIETLFSINDKGMGGTFRYFTEIDDAPKSGDNYYRLRLEMPGGEVLLSEWKFLHFEDTNKPQLFPNPVQQFANVLFAETMDAELNIRVSDQQGRIVVVKSTRLKGRELPLDFSGFENGIYFLSIQESGQRPKVLKVLVEQGF